MRELKSDSPVQTNFGLPAHLFGQVDLIRTVAHLLSELLSIAGNPNLEIFQALILYFIIKVEELLISWYLLISSEHTFVQNGIIFSELFFSFFLLILFFSMPYRS
jgi:hypothetical protein